MIVKIIIYLLTILFLFGCFKTNKSLDINKLDIKYFCGKYESNYFGRKEILFLYSNRRYQYIANDNMRGVVKINGSWDYFKSNYPTIYLYNFPNYYNFADIQKDSFLSNRNIYIDLDFHVNVDLDEKLGDLQAFTLNEDKFIFKKLDKGKNINYLLKE